MNQARSTGPLCPECGAPGPHWVASPPPWGGVKSAGNERDGFWVCDKFYGADGRRLTVLENAEGGKEKMCTMVEVFGAGGQRTWCETKAELRDAIGAEPAMDKRYKTWADGACLCACDMMATAKAAGFGLHRSGDMQYLMTAKYETPNEVAGLGTEKCGCAAETEIEGLRQDAMRYRWLRKRLMAADFDWQDSGECALVFSWPKECAVSGNCDATIDAAMLVTPNPENGD